MDLERLRRTEYNQQYIAAMRPYLTEELFLQIQVRSM